MKDTANTAPVASSGESGEKASSSVAAPGLVLSEEQPMTPATPATDLTGHTDQAVTSPLGLPECGETAGAVFSEICSPAFLTPAEKSQKESEPMTDDTTPVLFSGDDKNPLPAPTERPQETEATEEATSDDTAPALFPLCEQPSLLPAPEQGQKESETVEPMQPMQPMEETQDQENPLMEAAAAFIKLCADMSRTAASSEASEAWWDESPILEGAARWPEVCAGICMSAFGSQIVPEVDQDKHGTDSQNALQVGRVYLAAPVGSPARHAFEVLALVIHRLTQAAAE